MSKVILSLDGGGIRGAATTQFLSRVEAQLEDEHQTTLLDCVDFVAGTSTGAFIALGLAADLSVRQIDELYNVSNASKIFTPNKGWFEIDGFNAPRYEARGKTRLLKKHFGPDTTLANIGPHKHVLVVTYAVEKRTPIVIKSTEPRHRDIPAYRVADASSAAPTYFPTAQVDIPPSSDNEHWLIDGGVVANNPTMCAISEVRNVWSDTPMDEIKVLSVGTGCMTRKVNGPASRKWGALEWFIHGHILDVLADERIVAYQARHILSNGNYIRVNAELREQPGLHTPPDDAMDDISKSNLKKLRALGDFWFDRYGTQAVELLLRTYQGPSLDRIDPKTGNPKQ